MKSSYVVNGPDEDESGYSGSSFSQLQGFDEDDFNNFDEIEKVS